MIELKKVSKTYDFGETEVQALREVSLTIEPGEFIAIMGPSGSGKSTMLHILGLLDKPDSGTYTLFGKDVHTFSDDELAVVRNQMIGFVFQQFHLLRRMSALKNVSLPNIYGPRTKKVQEKAIEKLTSVGLKDRTSHWPSKLSGGEQQRVAIARALIKEPLIVFADEPTGNLDTKSEEEIMSILKALNAQGKTIIMVTHEQEVAEYAQRIITMRDGKILSDEKKAAAKTVMQDTKRVEEIFSKKHCMVTKEECAGHFRQAVNAIISNKVRSLLSMLGILVGVGAVIAMMALGEGARLSMEQQLKSLGSNLLSVRAGSSRFHGAASGAGTVARFSFRDVEDIRALKTLVKRVSGVVSGSGQVVYQNENWNTRIEGAGYDYAAMRAATPQTGRWFSAEEIQKRKKVVVIGSTVVNKLFKDKNPLGATIKIKRVNFRVIGIAPERGFAGHNDQDDILYVPVTTAMYRLLGKTYLDGIYIEVTDAAVIKQAQAEIEDIIKKRHRLYQEEDAFNIRDMSEMQKMLTQTTQTMSLLLGCIAAISLMVGGIGIMNIMLVSVTERTREIGLRKAIGARKIDVMLQFLVEAVVMSLAGGLLGIALGTGTALLITFFAGWATKVSVFSVTLATTFSVAVGICFGLWPAKKAAGLSPVEALRYE